MPTDTTTALSDTIPVYAGTNLNQAETRLFEAEGAVSFSAIFSTGPVAHIARPPQLEGKPGAYACYIIKEQMVPKFNRGEVIYVDPTIPYRAGDFAILIPKLPEAGAPYRQIVSIHDGFLRCRQLNPEQEFDAKLDDLAAVHVIVGTWNSR